MKFYLLERQIKRHTETLKLDPVVHSPDGLQTARVEPAFSQEAYVHLGLSCECQGSDCGAHPLLPCQACWQEAGLETQLSGVEPDSPIWNVGIPSHWSLHVICGG